MNDNQLLSRMECSALRGIAILGIMLHNYCHWLGFAVKENEYTFVEMNTDRLLQALLQPDIYLPVHLLSFFGHYGVPLFLFLSGYGLVLKYETGRQAPKPLPFIKYHYLKLLRMMIPGFVTFIIVDAITPGAWHFHSENVIALILMYVNILPEPDRIIWPGPYWFFGLMMQLYIIYILLLRRHWGFTACAIAVCWALQAVCLPEGDALNRLRYNSIGGILPFGLGLLFARYAPAALLPVKGYLKNGIAAMSLTFLIVVMSFGFQAWLWVPAVVIAAAIAWIKAVPAHALQYLSWIGGISAAMFVAHPILRKIFIPISRRGDIYDGLLLYIIAVVAVSWMFKLLTDRIPTPKMK